MQGNQRVYLEFDISIHKKLISNIDTKIEELQHIKQGHEGRLKKAEKELKNGI